ncbi:MAG: hypothetical protein OEX22_02845 [Cyclobacteriaceae bacterium]|nr:hypothetical protein [Cyclobacteriaceae bacterium]
MSGKKTEDSNKNVAWVVSITLHVLLLLAFIFMVAWREPNPPFPEYGIEVNFGTSSVGSGEIQPVEPINDTQNVEDSQPEESSEEVVEENIVEQIIETNENSNVQENEVITQTAESPDVIEEEPKEEIEQPIEEPIKEEVIEKPVEEIPQKVKNPIVYKKKDGADGESGDSATPENANNGDDESTVGDKGSKEGTLDARTVYDGNKGGGGGAPALKISGWFWDNEPNKKDASSENGIIEFSFVVDDEGYVGNIQVIQSTVSPSVANFYKEQLRNTTFSQTNPNIAPLSQTKGTVKFIIKSR